MLQLRLIRLTISSMNNVLTYLLSEVLVYKYLAIFVITFLGAIALPLPSGSVLMAAIAFATQGYFNAYWVWVIGLAGNIAGDNAGYWLVRFYGIRILNKLRLGKFFPDSRLEAARASLDAHPIPAIFFTRFFTSIAPAVNVVSGISRLPYGRYLLFESLGELTEVSCFCILGYIFGSNWEYISKLSGWFLVLILAGWLTSYLVWKIVFKKKPNV